MSWISQSPSSSASFRSRYRRISAVAVVGLLCCSALGREDATERSALQRGLLYADLWVQTSAEYVACCLQTYQLAGDRVEQEVEKLRADDAHVPNDQRGLPPAVIMDLDETVLDNAVYQTYLYDIGQNYTEENWTHFQKENPSSIRLVPGAKDFIDRVESLGATVVYITNREEPIRQATVDTLNQWGINTAGLDDPNSTRLLMQTHGESVKKPRRDVVRAKYRVLALLGDQLGDFSDEFAPNHDDTAAARREAAYEYKRMWGNRWFVLPNPVYGQWQQVLRGPPEQYLRRAANKAATETANGK
jgi:acid phosphatase